MKFKDAHQIHIALAALFFFYLGKYNDFLPYKTWSEIGIVLGITTSIFYTKYILIDKSVRAFSKKYKFLFAVFFLPFFSYISWGAIVHGIPYVFNDNFGVVEENTVDLEKKTKNEKNECFYRVEGVFLRDAFPPHFCIEKDEFEKPSNITTIKFSGNRTWFGYQIKNYKQER